MPKSVYDRGLLKPADIARLQRVFDEACQRRQAHPDSAEAREIALTLLALHNAGMSLSKLISASTLDRMAFQ